MGRLQRSGLAAAAAHTTKNTNILHLWQWKAVEIWAQDAKRRSQWLVLLEIDPFIIRF